MQLYKIKDEYLKALDDLSADETLTPEIINDSLSLIIEDFDNKVLNIGAYIKNLEADIVLIKSYQAEMDKRKEKIENKIDKLKDYLKFNMEACKRDKIKGVEFNISLRESAGSIVVENEKSLNEKWFIIKTERNLDKISLKEALNNGEIIKGVHLRKSKYIVIN
jgi:hypothetical protein